MPQRKSKTHDWPPIPVPPLRDLPEAQEVKRALEIIDRSRTVHPPPATIAGISAALHLEEADEDDEVFVKLLLGVNLELGFAPADEPRVVRTILHGRLGDDACPGWVMGCAACISAIEEAALKVKVEEALNDAVRSVLPPRLGRVGGVRLEAQAPGLAEALGGLLGGDGKVGDAYESMLAHKIAQRRRVALGMPVDRARARTRTDKLDAVAEMVQTMRDILVAAREGRGL